jgi:galactose mutarotase-like enzyme
MVTLQNNEMTIVISEIGAELQSIKAADGTEYLWNGDAAFWAKRAPVLFPICGALKDNEFCYEGKTYTLEKHGYARFETFEVEKQTETEAVFLLRSDDKSRAMYPFEYELRIGYQLNGKTLNVSYDVANLDATPLYMSIGCHEAYACPEGIEAYEIVFPEEETLYTTPDPLHSDDKQLVIENSTVLPLREEDYAIDALIFRGGTRSDSLVLRHKETGRGLKIAYEGFKHLLLWQPYKAPFICVEPWCGYPDTTEHDGDITKKLGIQKVDGCAAFHRVHSMTLL